MAIIRLSDGTKVNVALSVDELQKLFEDALRDSEALVVGDAGGDQLVLNPTHVMLIAGDEAAPPA